MTNDSYNILFLCTGNSARSIMAEAIMNAEGAGIFHAYSAGSHPKGRLHPCTADVLTALGHPTGNLRSKGWDEFSGPDAPKMDFVFTVCDDAAGEQCPVWPGQPMTAHWGIPDPAAVEGSSAEQHAAFLEAYRMLRNRITLFLALPLRSIDGMSLRNRLTEIGRQGRGMETP
jgi:arsenate reductase